MRSLLALVAAVARSIARTIKFVYEGGKWILRAVSGAQPDPVLPATAMADDYLAAADRDEVDPMPTVGGIPARSVSGVTLVSHARHIVAGDPPVDLAVLSDEAQVWLASLSHDELAVLARSMPRDAEELAQGLRRIPGLPPLHADASKPEADVSAWDWRHKPEDHDPAKDAEHDRIVEAYWARTPRPA